MINRLDRMRAAKDWLPCCGETDDAGICMAPACSWGEAVKSLSRAADDIEALRAERDALKARVEELEAISAEIYSAKCSDTEAYVGRIRELQRQHDARATELLEANNREVERRRRAEQFRTDVTCPECGIALGLTDHHLDCETGAALDKKMSAEVLWRMKNKPAIQALIDGRAAVVPLKVDLWQED